MEEKNRVADEELLENVQGGVNLNGADKGAADKLAGLKVGGSLIHKDAKNTSGNNSIFIKQK